MQTIVANVEHINFELEVQIEMQHGTLPLPFPGMDKSNSAVCQFYKHHSCIKAALCPFRHVKGDKAVVCKHWLRGLCKKGDECEFLHQFDMTKMPECFFFAKFGMCSNKDCPFLHIDPDTKRKDCPWYDRGFCKHGPVCKNRHVRRVYCPSYLLGFCPEGTGCKFVHPTFDLPMPSDMKDQGSKKMYICHSCGEPGHKASYCPKRTGPGGQPYQTAGPPMSFSQKQAAEREQGQGMRKIYHCHNCGEQGHKAIFCPKKNQPSQSTGASVSFNQNQAATDGNRVLGNSDVNSHQPPVPRGRPFQPRSSSGGPKSYDHITCYKCGEKGHFANHCPKGHLAFLSNALPGNQQQHQQQ